GVENTIWDRAGPLTTGDWEKVRLHSYLTERILSRCQALAGLADLAASHHERLDGSGYHRSLAAPHLATEGRILAAADTMAALLADRPHRPAFSPEAATALMSAEAKKGELDPDAVKWVVAAVDGTVVLPV